MFGDDEARGPRPLPARRALVDDVYDAVLGLLMDRVIEPGARVNIDAVARDLDVSPTPVREALTRLEAEGLVAKRALKGYVAAPLLDAAGLRDLYDMRELLEPEAARRASTRLDDDTEAELAESVAQMRAASAPDEEESFRNYRRFIDEDLRFHHLIAEHAESPLLAEAIVRLRSHMHLYRLNFRHDFEDDTANEHQRILDALCRRDAAAAAEAMRAHIENSYERLGPALARRAANASE
ncbi:DNA-binding GntR family transcriptional regulator [Microbacterium phyllosphaerae]|uniref:DNA-binding GntR family transcriptional regulator n=1 Tax=Microbacterium phyllosphaerae TaxID=124798 RepID=A0ABS4WLY0_9MICO|nr:GntR family transcriptional regulator [Microbacterium phyllosphaerae]MBP2377148.1 DNA-binding GntR family transcriptional regulator [Microbacterium phyllosphaerae]